VPLLASVNGARRDAGVQRGHRAKGLPAHADRDPADASEERLALAFSRPDCDRRPCRPV